MTTAILLAAAICNAEVCPERQNDFCWENDKFGMRAYGPGEYHKWSGWDVFNKTPGEPGAAAKLLHGKGVNVNWHEVPFGGVLDNYTMGASRGLGGIAFFGDGEWKTYPDWESSKVIHVGDDYCEFELVYPAFAAVGKMTCHVTLKRGERFFRNDVDENVLQRRLMDYASARDCNVTDLHIFNNAEVLMSIGVGGVPLPFPYVISYRELQYSCSLVRRKRPPTDAHMTGQEAKKALKEEMRELLDRIPDGGSKK